MLLKPLYQSSDRRILFDPIVQDNNRIKIILISPNDRTGNGGGKISIFKSGTAMFLGFKRVKTIIEEYKLMKNILIENGYKMAELKLEPSPPVECA